MNSANIENTAVRPKGVVKAKLSRDDIIMRGGMIVIACLLYTSPSPRDKRQSRMPSSA